MLGKFGAASRPGDPGKAYGRDDMRQAVLVALLLGLLEALPLHAQEPACPATAGGCPDQQYCAEPAAQPTPTEGDVLQQEVPWQTVWGLVGLRIIPRGPKIAPNGNEYHPNFSF